MSIKSIPRIQLKKLLRHEVTLYKLPDDFLSSNTFHLSGDPLNIYGVRGETFQTYTIKAEIQPITMEDEAQAIPGLIHTGDAWGFFLPYYELEGEEISVEPEDQIKCEGITYEVARIEDHYQGNNIVWRRAYLRRIVAEG